MRRSLSAPAALALLIVPTLLWFAARPRADVVVYCAHDAVFAEKILADFQNETGLRVVTRYDAEATKTLGLVELLQAERAQPRADVFWNNELLGTAALAADGLFEPYQGTGWQRIPPQWRDPEGRWCGFAARFRVRITGPKPADGTAPAWATPLYGTTLTHFTLLWKMQPAEAWRGWLKESKADFLRGNSAVAQAVADGARSEGFTDTDDYFARLDAGQQVKMQRAFLPDGRTICIPNTVGILRNAPHADAARRLVDYLLRAETELALARSKSRQLPLGPLPPELESKIPADVRELQSWLPQAAPLDGLVPVRAEVLGVLKAELADGK